MDISPEPLPHAPFAGINMDSHRRGASSVLIRRNLALWGLPWNSCPFRRRGERNCETGPWRNKGSVLFSNIIYILKGPPVLQTSFGLVLWTDPTPPCPARGWPSGRSPAAHSVRLPKCVADLRLTCVQISARQGNFHQNLR